MANTSEIANLIKIEELGLKQLQDRNAYSFVVDSWVKSFRPVTESSVPQKIYDVYQRKVIDSFLKVSKVLLATAADDPNKFIGFLVYQNGKLGTQVHWTYVKFSFRKTKVASLLAEHVSLVPNGYLDFSHFPASPAGVGFARKHRATYCPYHNIVGLENPIEHTEYRKK